MHIVFSLLNWICILVPISKEPFCTLFLLFPVWCCRCHGNRSWSCFVTQWQGLPDNGEIGQVITNAEPLLSVVLRCILYKAWNSCVLGAYIKDVTLTPTNTKETCGKSAVGAWKSISNGHWLFVLQVVSSIPGEGRVITMWQWGFGEIVEWNRKGASQKLKRRGGNWLLGWKMPMSDCLNAPKLPS